MSEPRRILIGCGLLSCLVLAGCDPKEKASAECDARAIEHGLTGIDGARHKNLCMKAAGYSRNNLCQDFSFRNSSAAMCFKPEWEFWTEKQGLL